MYGMWQAGQIPDSAINRYKDIRDFAERENDKQLRMHADLLYRMSLLCNAYNSEEVTEQYNKYTEDILALINTLKKRDDKYLYTYSLLLYSNLLDRKNNLTSAFEYKLRAYDKYIDYTQEEFPNKPSYISSLGGSYYRFRDFHSSAKCMKAAIEYKEYDNNYFTSLNTFALCYRNLHNWDTAEFYFNRLYQESVEKNNLEWQLIATLNLGHTYYRSGRIDKSYKYFTNAYEFAQKHNYNYGVTESTSTLARIALQRKEYDKAKELALIGTYVHRGFPGWYYHYSVDAQRLFEVLADIYEHEGNYKLAYRYMDSLLMVVDSTSLYRQLNFATAIQTKSKLLTEKYLREKENAALAHNRQKQTRYLAIAGVVIIILISVLLINRQRIKRRQIEAEKLATETKLRASKKELHNYTGHLQEKNKLIEKFSRELENYKEAATQQDKNEVLLRLQQSTILTDDDWLTFRTLFEQAYPGFLQRLKEKVPDLTPGEIRFMVLSKLQLSTREMAAILGVGTSTIRKYRHQVRNKLGLPEDSNIEDIAGTI